MAKQETGALGLGALPLAVAKHPIASLGQAEILERAAAIIAEVRHILTGRAEQLTEEYSRRRYVQPREVFGPGSQTSAACPDPEACGLP